MNQTDRNLEIAKNAYVAFGKGDIPALIATMSDDVKIGIVGRQEDAPFLGPHDGKAGAADFFRLLGEAHDIHTFEPQRFIAAEDKVFIWGSYRWTMRKSGVSRQSEWLHVLTFHDGKLVVWNGHNDTAMLAEAYHGLPSKKLASVA